MEQQSNKLKTRKLHEITGTIPYGFYIEIHGEKVGVNCDPSAKDIERAINDKDLEARGFQSHQKELESEWAKGSPDFQEYCRRVRSYHARRIAHFAVNGWNGDPITLKADGSMCDGLHRWRAAKHLGMEEVEVIIAGEV